METLNALLTAIGTEIINPIIAVLFGLAFLLFVWGGIVFILNASSEEARETGKRHLLWGIVGMFIMLSVYSILYLIVNTLGTTLPSRGTAPSSSGSSYFQSTYSFNFSNTLQNP